MFGALRPPLPTFVTNSGPCMGHEVAFGAVDACALSCLRLKLARMALDTFYLGWLGLPFTFVTSLAESCVATAVFSGCTL